MNNIMEMIVKLGRDRVKLQMNRAILRDISGKPELSHLLPLLDDSTMTSIERAIVALKMPNWVKDRIVESELSDALSDVLVEIEREFGYSATLLFRWGTLLERLPWFAGVASALKSHDIFRPDQRAAFQYLATELKTVLRNLGISEDWSEKILDACQDGNVEKVNEYLETVQAQIDKSMERQEDSDGEENKQISILFLAADPWPDSRLQVGKEFREIDEQLTLSKQREQFRLLLPQLALRARDIVRSLLNHQPYIVHFSGHGAPDGAIYFEDEDGKAHAVQPSTLSALFEQFANKVKCVVLNACYTEPQARAIAKHIDYVIGMKQGISDNAAIAFSLGFYGALGAGHPIEKAFEIGRIMMMFRETVPEHVNPVLIKREQAQS